MAKILDLKTKMKKEDLVGEGYEKYPKKVGEILIAELEVIDKNILNNGVFILDQLEKIAIENSHTIMESRYVQFPNCGSSGFIILAESHLSFHTWCDECILSIDFFTCKKNVDWCEVMKKIKEVFNPVKTNFIIFDRKINDE